MSNNSDPLFDRYAVMDFSDAKPVSEIPALSQLQAEQERNIKSIIWKLRKAVTDSQLHMDMTSITAHVLVTAQKLTYKYGIQKQKIDSLDAIHLALVMALSAKNRQPVTLITSDERMIEICENESIAVFNPAKQSRM